MEDVVRHLDRVIDKTYYPLKETGTSNMRHRPMGIGVQGLSDVFQMLNLPYGSDKALALDKLIFKHMCFYAHKSSCALRENMGIFGSPASKGQLQFDLHGLDANRLCPDLRWDELGDIREFGLRNSLLLALMPTASTAQILGNSRTDPGRQPLQQESAERFMVENHVLRDELDLNVGQREESR